MTIRFAGGLWRTAASACSIPTQQFRSISDKEKYVVVNELYKKKMRDFRKDKNMTREGAPFKPIIDLKAILSNAEELSSKALLRNYSAVAQYPSRIQYFSHARQDLRSREPSVRRKATEAGNEMRAANMELEAEWINGGSVGDKPRVTEETHPKAFRRSKMAKEELAVITFKIKTLEEEIEKLAMELPNEMSPQTPIGEAEILTYLNEAPENGEDLLAKKTKSHVEIGAELGILDFAGSANTSGWGHYFLLGDGARLEQALIQYALAVATSHDWTVMSVPSLIYEYIGKSCGFNPRDNNDEQQVYEIAQDPEDLRPSHVLAGTAEIPLAGSKTDSTIDWSELPIKCVATSRCFRAEAGSRGAETKGLYRVHEFTKVEMFAWTSDNLPATTEVFDEIIDIQSEILSGLGLRCRILEMPVPDLGAPAYRKVDIEAFFPSRQDVKDSKGWGEVTSTSICTDYQTRRLATRLMGKNGKLAGFPWTVNGTALAVPRVLAGILEAHWDEETGSVVIPEVLRPWMGGQERIMGKGKQAEMQ